MGMPWSESGISQAKNKDLTPTLTPTLLRSSSTRDVMRRVWLSAFASFCSLLTLLLGTAHTG